MFALVKKFPKVGLWKDKVAIPKISDDEVLVKVKNGAICGTDLHIHNWDSWSQRTIKTPLVIGHEWCGHVVDVGKNVRNLPEGTLVSAEGHITCGECRACLSGQRESCRRQKGIGVNVDGAFAE